MIQFPSIESIDNADCKPFWSVMITAYKRTPYLERALKSILDQGISADDMQIEVVDDCSPNRNEIEAIVNQVGQGRITFYSSPRNVGIYVNWNVCIERSRGKWVHILSDDDMVIPGFYEAYRRSIETYKPMVVIGQSVLINEKDQWMSLSPSLQANEGLLDDALLVLAKGNQIRTPGIVVARAAYEQVGGFSTDLVFTPDWEMWTRLAAAVKVAYVNQPYSLFRMHTGSETSRLILSATSVTDSLLASQIIQSRLSNSQQQQEIRAYNNRWLSVESRALSRRLTEQEQYVAALRHALWVLRLTPSLSALTNIGATVLRILQSMIKGALKPKANSSTQWTHSIVKRAD